MNYDLIETIITIFDIFNNPVGIAGAIVAFLTGILMCIYGNKKSRFICVCSLLLVAIFSIVALIAGNSPDYLIFPIFVLPFFIVTSIIFLIYDLIKILK